MASTPYIPWHIWRKVRDLLCCILAGLIALELGGWDIKTNLGLSPTKNPYLLPGYLSISPWNPHENRWMPFTSSPPPALLASLLRSSWRTLPPSGVSDIRDPKDWWEGEVGPDGKDWEDVTWAKGRTVLVLGDSVGRFHVKYLCEMAGEPFHEMPWGHPFSPPKMEGEEAKSEEERLPETIEEIASSQGQNKSGNQNKRNLPRDVPSPQWDIDSISPEPENGNTNGTILGRRDGSRHIGNEGGYMGHYCHIPGIDLMVIQVFNYGLDEKNFWTLRGDYIPPYTIESRLTLLAAPYIRKAGRPTTAPELTYVGSALWDTTRWMREDAAAGKDISQGLTKERLYWYRTRTRQVLMHARQVFPETKLKWASHHYPLRAMSGWFFESGNQDQKPQRPQQKLNRLAPLHEAAKSAIDDLGDTTTEQKSVLKDVDMGMWGKRMIGMEDHQKDDLHQNLLPGGYLWADMMLYDLREAVTKKWWKP
ncbi:uncharacterized protein IL334_006304 [Kwoniella shivajii]|uniref:SGNH hydrolase-type esterase domain-containing protein n=1 Tax=Kwoniella shivajii TaxID=564305 RepID=A0ABZ1D7G7_9TREE|nr:hypothetical protein IL334_006304 [Kwoniella shivajii]